MARGFESKAVQDQQEEAQRKRKPAPPDAAPAVGPALLQARRTLELARTDVSRRHAASASEVQRHSLALALEEIDRQLAALPVSEPLRD